MCVRLCAHSTGKCSSHFFLANRLIRQVSRLHCDVRETATRKRLVDATSGRQRRAMSLMLAIGNLDAERTTRGNTTPPFAVKSNAGGGTLYFGFGKTSQRVIHDNARPSPRRRSALWSSCSRRQHTNRQEQRGSSVKAARCASRFGAAAAACNKNLGYVWGAASAM